LSTLADFVSRADAFIDASVPGMLGSLLNGIPLPDQTAQWAPGARSDPPAFARALRRVLEAHGGPVTRRHILAAALCQSSKAIQPDLAWMDETDLAGLIVSYVHLIAAELISSVVEIGRPQPPASKKGVPFQRNTRPRKGK
jgi:hypothetical protein